MKLSFSCLQGLWYEGTAYHSTKLAKLHSKYKVRNKHVSYEISICNNNENQCLQRSMWNLTNSLQYLVVKYLQLPCSSSTELYRRSFSCLQCYDMMISYHSIRFANLHAKYEVKNKHVSYEISICNNNQNHTLQLSMWNHTNSL
jgi:hypothetical protein